MLIGFIGDIHGDFKIYQSLCTLAETMGADCTIQGGDYGVGFGRVAADETRWSNPGNMFTEAQLIARFGPFYKQAMGSEPVGIHRFIRGNHDNPMACLQNNLWIPDGQSYNGVFCVGGAYSIDRSSRQEGWDWWPNEELSYGELEMMIENYKEAKPKIVISHDAPECIARSMFTFYRNHHHDRTRGALEAMYACHQPDLHLTNHWHVPYITRRGGTVFRGLGINEMVFYNTETKVLSTATELSEVV